MNEVLAPMAPSRLARKARGSSDVLIEAAGLGVRRSGRWLVRHIDIAVSCGEIVTLIGPNGGGKTTIAKALLGLIKVDEGKVRRAADIRTAYVPQKITIDRTLPLSVRRLMTLTAHFSDEEIDQALGAVGMERFADVSVQTLSGGEFQRALLARALIRTPDLLILDEPVQGVDFTGEVALYDLIGAIRDELGCGILLISHDLHIVMAKTDRVVCVNGHICCSGLAETVAEDPAYRQMFGAKAADTLAVYRHHHDHVHGVDGCIITPEKPRREADAAHAGSGKGEEESESV